MACRGCSSDGCGCSVTGDGVIITVSGSGTPVTDPYLIELDVDEALGSITIDDATDCSLLDTPRVPVVLGTGATLLVPLPCTDETDTPVSGHAFAFTWESGILSTDVGAGYIGFNNGTYGSVTAIHVSNSETLGTSIADWLVSLNDHVGSPKGVIKVYSRTDPTKWATFKMTGQTTPTVGMVSCTVEYMDHAGTFSDAIIGDIVFDFAPASEGSLGGFNSVQTIEAVTGAYTLDLADAGKYLRCANASPFSVTVPLNATVAFTIGTHIDLIQSGAGQVTIAATGGVTINATPGLKLNGQWAGATLVKVGTNEWDLVGNLTS
jgi:hypothetical protein